MQALVYIKLTSINSITLISFVYIYTKLTSIALFTSVSFVKKKNLLALALFTPISFVKKKFTNTCIVCADKFLD